MKKLFLLFFGFLLFSQAYCQTKFDVEKLLSQKPVNQTLVNDFAGILTGDQAYTLEQKLENLSNNTSTQIAVVIVPNLGGYDVADFNQKLLRAWGIGSKKNNNGVILLISKEDKKLNIATGYGVEGALPDVTSRHIIDEQIVPSFKGNDYYRGIDNGTTAIVQAVKGEYNDKTSGKSSGSGKLIFIILLAIIVLIVLSRGGGSNGTFMSRRGGTGIGNAILLNALFGGGGGWSGGGGSDSGGGFGGFGGGSGGGGGASGSW